MSNHKHGFRSQAERERDDALCCHYGRIGIPAVAAAKSVEHRQRQPKEIPFKGAKAKLDVPGKD